MSFLAPFFILGSLAIGLPLLFHLVRRSTKERTPFSSLLFLSPSPPRLARRNRLEDLLLLLLRCAVVLLLAFAFARPFLKSNLPEILQPENPKRLLVLIDTSASMQRSGVWEAAVKQAVRAFEDIGETGSGGLFAFSRQFRPVLPFELWDATPAGERMGLVRQKLEELAPDWGATRTAQALMAAAELAADSDANAARPTRLLLITDLQEGSRLSDLQGYVWPNNIELAVATIPRPHTANAGIQLVLEKEDAPPKDSPGVNIRVQNETGSTRQEFKAGWKQGDTKSFVGQPLAVYVPPGQSRVVFLPAPAPGTPADRIVLEGDNENFDNTVYMAPPEPARVNVLYIGSEKETDPTQPLFFLRRALQNTRQQAIHVVSAPPSGPWPEATLPASTLFVVTEALPAARAASLKERVQAGSMVLLAPRTAAGVAETLRELLQNPKLSVAEGRVANYAMLSEIDFRHPLFDPFSDPRFSDFTRIRFWAFRKLTDLEDSPHRFLAKFDNDDPAIVEFPVGKGTVLFWASTWSPKDSQLALSSKFVPLLYSVLRRSGAPEPMPPQFFVGDTIPMENTGSGSWIVNGPDHTETSVPPDSTGFTGTALPGLYTTSTGSETKRFAVNLDPAESRTGTLASEDLERLGAPLSRDTSEFSPPKVDRRRLLLAELESRQKLWRWLILGAIVVLFVETWLAGRTLSAAKPVGAIHG